MEDSVGLGIASVIEQAERPLKVVVLVVLVGVGISAGQPKSVSVIGW